MIRISQIDSDLSIYKNNIVVLLRKEYINNELFTLLKYNNVKPSFICDPNKKYWGGIVRSIPIISPKQLEHMIKEHKKLNKIGFVLQVATPKMKFDFIKSILDTKTGIVLSYEEAWQVFNYMNKLKILNQSPTAIKVFEPLAKKHKVMSMRKKMFDFFSKYIYLNEYVIVCSIQKTGDITLIKTLNNNNVTNFFAAHTPEILDKELISNSIKKIKIITGLRDPISQNLSFLYQHISNLFSVNFSYHLNENSDEFFKNGGDAQKLFDLGFGNAEGFNGLEPCIENFTYVSDFFSRFQENIIDLSKYPFDKEKGYIIVKEGNLEVFVYQLEKMNDIVKEISNWVGQTPFNELVTANEADNKWIANSYNQAKKEITFSQEYFDKCYNDPWVQHFYSQEDIEKFKERWRTHIK